MSTSSTNMIIIVRCLEIESIDKTLLFHQVNCSRTNMFYPMPYRFFMDRKYSIISVFSTSDEV